METNDSAADSNGSVEVERTALVVLTELKEGLEKVLAARAENKATRIKRVTAQLVLVSEIEERIGELTANQNKPKKSSRGNNNEKPLSYVDPELRKFLGVGEEETLSRLDIVRGINTYVHRKEDRTSETFTRWEHLNPPEVNRDLRNEKTKSIIELDETLTRVLKYDEYVAAVKAGEVKTRRKVQGSNSKALVVKTDWRCTFPIIGHLVSKLVES